MKTKVLHILGGMGRGGAPSFIINNLEKIDDQKVQFDFLVRKDNCAFNDVLKRHDSRLFVVPEFPSHAWSNMVETYKVFKQYGKEYTAIHVHANALYYVLPFILAKLFGVKITILHSHNTQSNVKSLQALHYLNKLFVGFWANTFLACAVDAGKWMFGKKHFEVINNAVDVNKFIFNQANRSAIRLELGIPESSYVIGNVGRFEEVKNHRFIIDIFNEYLKVNSNAYLLLPGDGSLWQEMDDKVKSLGISDKVRLTGVRSDIDKMYSAMDLLLMPSHYEGLPFVLIEAQCAGLKCMISENVTEECILTDLCCVESLSHDASEWSNRLANISDTSYDRSQYAKVVKEKGYDINDTAQRLTEIYTSK